MAKITFRKSAFVVLILALAACSSEPKVNEFSATADPQAELEKIDSNLRDAQNRQVDVLSPRNFEDAQKAKAKAIGARSANKDQKKILHEIAVSQAYLDRANQTAQVADPILKDAITARQNALAAHADRNFSKELKDIDQDLKSVTKDVEKNDTASAQKKHQDLASRYLNLELKSIKADKLGTAKADVDQAVKEGAKKLTPETLASTEKQIATEEAVIAQDRHNTEAIDQASARAKAAGERLLRMVRTAKSAGSKNPEQLAKQIEQNEHEAALSEHTLTQAERELARTKDRLADQSEQTKALESQAWLDREYDAAMKEFSKDEAEVYKQGDNLLLRLKGLSFANSKADLNDKNYALLEKVKKVIADVDASAVTIEGHTDSSGSKAVNEKLSQKRAEAVEAYLTADSTIDAEKITTQGFGDSKPITTNKTAAGRAQNRRVDVIITGQPAETTKTE